MSSDERRIAPRKVFSIPIRFHALANEAISVAANQASLAVSTAGAKSDSVNVAGPTRVRDMQDGVTVNLSERGIYFKSAKEVKVGQSVEVYFTLPRELTGRNSEPVRCCARVVHVDQVDDRGLTGVGASVERFEPLNRFRTWDN